MEITKISDRVEKLENQSNDGTEETKSVGAVNIEFTGESDHICFVHILNLDLHIVVLQ